ncbi:MAG: hypothetical protein ABIP68_09545 [Ferruginibacter sp.]
MQDLLIYCGISALTGFIIGWLIQQMILSKIKKDYKSASGFLESERLKKEKLQKEIQALLVIKSQTEADLANKIHQLKNEVETMDYDIILLQKNNEDTEALLKAGDPIVYDLKVKLIEANNTISRLKGELNLK